MNQLIEEILEYSRLHYHLENRESPISVKLSTMFENIVINIQDEHPTHTIKLHCMDENLSIKGHKNMLDRAFENILRNACKHTPEQTPIDICVQQTNEKVEIQIRDYGPGINEPDLVAITTPFFRGEGIKQTSGYGLGLSISQRIIKHYRGIMNISNHPDRGLLISVIFPKV
jgi:two-component system, OmpR family, sensor kinase